MRQDGKGKEDGRRKMWGKGECVMGSIQRGVP